MIYYKLALLLVLAWMVLLMEKVVVSAIKVRQNSFGGNIAVRNMTVRVHRFYAYSTLAATVAFILLIEARRFFTGDMYRGKLLYIHVPFATMFLLLYMFLLLHMNGIKYPRPHRILGWICMFFFVITVGTGLPLILLIR